MSASRTIGFSLHMRSEDKTKMKLTKELLVGFDKDAKHQTTIPFSGFYNSIHGQIFDDAVDFLADELGRDPVEDADYKLDFKGFMGAYSKQYALEFGEYLFFNCNLDFEPELSFASLISPREYNFETDRIVGEITGDDVLKLFDAVTEKEFSAYLVECFTDRSGFISFYSNSLRDWMAKPLIDWDANEIGALLGCVLERAPDMCEAVYCENGREIASEFIEIMGN